MLLVGGRALAPIPNCLPQVDDTVNPCSTPRLQFVGELVEALRELTLRTQPD
jgi:hypothetical protein